MLRFDRAKNVFWSIKPYFILEGDCMKLEELVERGPVKHAHNFKDWTGFENEYFKVISEAPPLNKRIRWNCLCKACGNYCVKDATNLLKHKSCGCNKNKAIGEALRKDLSGKRFGMLTAIRYSGKSNVSQNAIWECKCDCGNICYVDSNNLTSLHTTSCGCLNSSIGVNNIIKLLKENNISYATEYKIKDLYDKDRDHPFRFDIAIYKDDILIRFIEYDGIQHYKQTWGVWKGNISLETQQERDHLKNKYALSHNIPLVRIPYWERDNITLDMLMGDKYLIKA